MQFSKSTVRLQCPPHKRFVYFFLLWLIHFFNVIYLFIYLFIYHLKSTPELAKLWNVGCHIWKRDFVAVYNALKEEWSPSIQPIIAALTGEI